VIAAPSSFFNPTTLSLPNRHYNCDCLLVFKAQCRLYPPLSLRILSRLPNPSPVFRLLHPWLHFRNFFFGSLLLSQISQGPQPWLQSLANRPSVLLRTVVPNITMICQLPLQLTILWLRSTRTKQAIFTAFHLLTLLQITLTLIR
jgi:hypothetical protein